MDQLSDLSDHRLKLWCIHCGGWLTEFTLNRDHVPTKGFLFAPYPENLPVVNVCMACNQSFSHDEEYMIAFMGAVLVGSIDPDHQFLPTAKRIFQRNEKIKRRIENARAQSDGKMTWRPEKERINRVLIKNARGHVYYELGETLMSEPTHVFAIPLECLTPEEKDNFEKAYFGGDPASWPEVGSRMMTRLLTGQDLVDGWVVVQNGIYRYAVDWSEGTAVRTILFEWLAAEVYWAE